MSQIPFTPDAVHPEPALTRDEHLRQRNRDRVAQYYINHPNRRIVSRLRYSKRLLEAYGFTVSDTGRIDLADITALDELPPMNGMMPHGNF